MAHEGCGHNFLRGLGYYDTRPLKGYFLCFSWLNYKMSPSWPKSAPNEDGVSADSRSLSTLRLCLAAAGDSSSDPQNRGPQWGGHMLAVLLHPLLSHAWGNLKKTLASSVLLSAASHPGTQQAMPWGGLKWTKATPAKSCRSHVLSSTGCQHQPCSPHGLPRTHHQPQQPKRAGRERDGHFNDTLHLLAGIQSQQRWKTAGSWKKGGSSENGKGNLSKPGSLSKGKNNQRDVCLQPTHSLTVSENIKTSQIWIIGKFATCSSGWGWEVSGRGFLGFPRLPRKEFGFVFKTKVHLLSTIQWR